MPSQGRLQLIAYNAYILLLRHRIILYLEIDRIPIVQEVVGSTTGLGRIRELGIKSYLQLVI